MTAPSLRTESAYISTPHGRFRVVAYEMPSGAEYAVLVLGQPDQEAAPLVRVQSSCLTGTAFGALLCDCATQVHLAMEIIATYGSGCLIYQPQEGRGHGLVEKIAHIRGINEDLDTVEAALQRGVPPDIRDYAEAALIIEDLFGDRSIRLLSNNPTKVEQLESEGVRIAERVSIETEPTAANRAYLLTKKYKLGHLLTKV